MNHTQKHINLLGTRVRDRVTGYSGVVTSIAFDLYGCIQAVVNPGLDKDGKPIDSGWFDVGRLEVTETTPVMTRPSFDLTPAVIAEGRKGPTEKPMKREGPR
jgi:hypothetical protein